MPPIRHHAASELDDLLGAMPPVAETDGMGHGARVIEQQCAQMAQNLLKTERLHLEELKRYVATEADDLLAETQKGCAEAEAEFYRTMSRSPGEGGAPPAVSEDVAILR